mgnify:CR=1 FL=1
MMIPARNIKDITVANLRSGEVSIGELDELYKTMGFLFVINQGKFISIRKERKNPRPLPQRPGIRGYQRGSNYVKI